MNIVSEKRRAAARKHAQKVWLCVCGLQGKGNGGWSSHKKACRKRRHEEQPGRLAERSKAAAC
jgi:hypothetical protein